MHSHILPSIDDIRLCADSPTINQISSSPKKKSKEDADLHESRAETTEEQQFVATFKLNYSFRYAKSMPESAMRR
jgi:hypothetical protein